MDPLVFGVLLICGGGGWGLVYVPRRAAVGLLINFLSRRARQSRPP